MKITYYILSLTLILLTSCIKNNPEPAWLEINTWTLVENLDIEEGALNHNFSDVYVTIDDKIVGYFELPIKLPILLDGNHKITLYPVVRNNGISATKKIFPFCESMVIYANLVKNESVIIHPKTNYVDGTQFWIEDFENTSFKIEENSSVSTAILLKGNDPTILKYGNFYGHLALNSTDSIWNGKTTPALVVPKQGKEVYLEIDYMNTNSLLTGVYANSDGSVKDNPNIQLNPQSASDLKWKKIYIDLKEIISSSITASDFNFYFTAILDAGLTSSDIYIDNIKLVHF